MYLNISFLFVSISCFVKKVNSGLNTQEEAPRAQATAVMSVSKRETERAAGVFFPTRGVKFRSVSSHLGFDLYDFEAG